MTDLAESVSQAELETLEAFLSSPALEHRSMDLSMLEGYLTAIVIGPHTLSPSEWMPWVWDKHEGKDGPGFADLDQGQHIGMLLMRFHNFIVSRFLSSDAEFEPLFRQSAAWGGGRVVRRLSRRHRIL